MDASMRGRVRSSAGGVAQRARSRLHPRAKRQHRTTLRVGPVGNGFVLTFSLLGGFRVADAERVAFPAPELHVFDPERHQLRPAQGPAQPTRSTARSRRAVSVRSPASA